MTTAGNGWIGRRARGRFASRLKLGCAVLAALLAAPAGAGAFDRAERRGACQEEARRHVRAPQQTDLDLYRRIVKRRQLYVHDCMLEGPPDSEQTGPISVPLPPRRPAAPDARPEGTGSVPL